MMDHITKTIQIYISIKENARYEIKPTGQT